MYRAGGSTFPEDPAQSCVAARPIWSADADPRVLRVRASRSEHEDVHALDLGRFETRLLFDGAKEHARIDGAGGVIRLDVTGGSLGDGPAALCFEIPDDSRLRFQLDAIRAYRAMVEGTVAAVSSRAGLVGKLLALHAYDARLSGSSLRDIAEALFGPGAWPGDGEYRKSRTRRLVASGGAMVRAGPRLILRPPNALPYHREI